MVNSPIQNMINGYAFFMTIVLWYALLMSFPDGYIGFHFNTIGEIWFELILMPIIGLFILLYTFRDLYKFAKGK